MGTAIAAGIIIGIKKGLYTAKERQKEEIMNKTAIITGASRGIGYETALLLAKNNYNVVINYNQSENEALKLLGKIEDSGGRGLIFKADIKNRLEVKKMVKKTLEVFGDIDLLVNNAGISSIKLFMDITEDEWDDMFDINVKGAFNLTQEVLPCFIHKKRGKIINISSMWGITGASCEVHYSASKAALIGFTKALAKELGPSNIQVNCIAPGVVETNMLNGLSDGDKKALAEEIPLGRFAIPAEIAELVLFLSSEKADYITGQVISPNGGLVI